MRKPKDVDAYIASAPRTVQERLRQLRAAIRRAAPDAEERISYGMPYYGYKGRLAYFRVSKNHIGLYLLPPVILNHRDELEKYETARATVRFPLNKKLPISLVKKLIKAGIKNNDDKKGK